MWGRGLCLDELLIYEVDSFLAGPCLAGAVLFRLSKEAQSKLKIFILIKYDHQLLLNLQWGYFPMTLS